MPSHPTKPLDAQTLPDHSVRTVVLQFMIEWKKQDPLAGVWNVALHLSGCLTTGEIVTCTLQLQGDRLFKTLCWWGSKTLHRPIVGRQRPRGDLELLSSLALPIGYLLCEWQTSRMKQVPYKKLRA